MAHLDDQIVGGSITAKREEFTEFRIQDARMLVHSYERYSAFGGNRVSLHVSILAVGPQLAVSLTTAGGSEAMFVKINTFGERAFLNKAVDALDSFAPTDEG